MKESNLNSPNELGVKSVARGIRLSLRAKLTLLIESCVIILLLFKRGLALTTDIAKYIQRPFLNDDLPTLRRYVNHSLEQEYVRYVVLLDTAGTVVMHSDLSEVGETYSDSLTAAALESSKPGYTDIQVSEHEELYYDMYTPIQVSGVRLGTVRLGYSRMAIEKEVLPPT